MLAEVYTNNIYGYSLAYPSGWTLHDQGEAVQIMDVMGTTVRVITDPMVGFALEEFLQLFIASLGQELPGFEVKSMEPIANPPGYQIEAEASFGAIGVKFNFIATVNERFAIVLMATLIPS